MQDKNYLWEIFIIGFGLYMIMTAPGSANYTLMIAGGLFFTVLGMFLIVLKKKRGKGK